MVEFKNSTKAAVTEEEMQRVYEKIKTPHKLGAVMKLDGRFTDSPTVFKKDGIYYMYFIAINKNCSDSGYETHLAKSKDLINWVYCGTVFRRNNLNRWDSKQCAGYAAFPDIDYDGTGELQKINGSYYISYLAGNNDGYEPDPLYMGLAKTLDLTEPDGFTRLPDPILRPDDSDCRKASSRTLYKSFLFEDKLGVTGYKYVNMYNAKGADYKERILLAVSDDAEHWERYGDRPVIDLVSGDSKGLICGDPQVILIDDIYVAFFFRLISGKPAFNTFACSRDLINWNCWDGKPLIESEYDWEKSHAHKTWFVRIGGRNYHFYCAVDDEKNERFIALAVSD